MDNQNTNSENNIDEKKIHNIENNFKNKKNKDPIKNIVDNINLKVFRINAIKDGSKKSTHYEPAPAPRGRSASSPRRATSRGSV
jgi:hypothetical protein